MCLKALLNLHSFFQPHSQSILTASYEVSTPRSECKCDCSILVENLSGSQTQLSEASASRSLSPAMNLKELSTAFLQDEKSALGLLACAGLLSAPACCPRGHAWDLYCPTDGGMPYFFCTAETGSRVGRLGHHPLFGLVLKLLEGHRTVAHERTQVCEASPLTPMITAQRPRKTKRKSFQSI